MDRLFQRFDKAMDHGFVMHAIANTLQDEKCGQLHVGSCELKSLIQFLRVVKSVFKMFVMAHLIPFLLFRIKKTKKNPKEEMSRFVVGLARSLLYAGLNGLITCRLICLIVKYTRFSHKTTGFSPGLGGIALILQSPTRQAETGLASLAKAFETVYLVMRRRDLAVRLPLGNVLINGAAFAIISYAFMSHHSTIKSGYNHFLNIFFKDI